MNSLLRPLGLQVTRLRFRSSDFYQPSPSCQIPTLGFLYELFFGQAEHGFFVEVGAYDGYSFSNTSCLAERGWSGLLIEPVSEYADQCRDRYSNREDIEILQVAVGSSDGTLSLHIAGPFTTASESQFTEYRELSAKELARDDTVISVQQSTLDAILESREIEHSFDLLVVDVEGYERAVFDGFTLGRWRPKMLIVELSDTHPTLSATRASDAILSMEIQDGGYEIVYKDSINTIFVHQELVGSALG